MRTHMINGKKVVGIVAEYNPFHTGHRYMLDEIRREYHADYIVAAMSGDFVQRGEPAMFDKYERAEEALKNGADLIVQIPVMFSTSSAEDFAAGGVAVLRSLGFVDELVFGSESADLEKLERMASVELAAGTKEYATFQNMVRDGVASGMSYPKARAEAMKAALLGDDETSFQALLQGVTAGKEVIDLRPNDVLGLEYLKAVHRQGDCFSVGCIRRNQELASAHSIRETMLKEPASLKGGYATLDMLSDMLSYRLLELCQLEERMREAPSLLTEYLDVSREIADALRHQVRERHSFSERIQIIKSRNYTYSRISRALLHILLDIQRKEHTALRGAYFGELEALPYVRVLGVRQTAKGLLSAIQTTVVASPAQYLHTLEELRRRETITSPEELVQSIATEHAEQLFRADLYAADLYHLIYRVEDAGKPGENEFTRHFLVVNEKAE